MLLQRFVLKSCFSFEIINPHLVLKERFLLFVCYCSSRQSRVRQQARMSLFQLKKLSQAGMIPPGMTDPPKSSS